MLAAAWPGNGGALVAERIARSTTEAARELEIARRLAGYLISTTGAPARTCTLAEADALDAAALRRLARQHDGHPLATRIASRLDQAAALVGPREPGLSTRSTVA